MGEVSSSLWISCVKGGLLKSKINCRRKAEWNKGQWPCMYVWVCAAKAFCKARPDTFQLLFVRKASEWQLCRKRESWMGRGIVSILELRSTGYLLFVDLIQRFLQDFGIIALILWYTFIFICVWRVWRVLKNVISGLFYYNSI